MDTFAQGVQITIVGMILVFLSLVVVAVLIWALDRIFRPASARATAAAGQAVPAPIRAAPAPTAPAAGETLAAQAAALAVALVLGRQRASRLAQADAPLPRAPMPWERIPASDEGVPEGEIVTVIQIAPGSGNWKAQGRIKAME